MSLLAISEQIGQPNATTKPLWMYELYDRYFAGLSEHRIVLLELGIHTGESLKVFATFFSKGRVIGVDWQDRRIDLAAYRNATVAFGDQRDSAWLAALAARGALRPTGPCFRASNPAAFTSSRIGERATSRTGRMARDSSRTPLATNASPVTISAWLALSSRLSMRHRDVRRGSTRRRFIREPSSGSTSTRAWSLRRRPRPRESNAHHHAKNSVMMTMPGPPAPPACAAAGAPFEAPAAPPPPNTEFPPLPALVKLPPTAFPFAPPPPCTLTSPLDAVPPFPPGAFTALVAGQPIEPLPPPAEHSEPTDDVPPFPPLPPPEVPAAPAPATVTDWDAPICAAVT